MIELSFHKDFYDGFAVDEATKAYGKFAAFELVDEPVRWVVRVTAADAAKEPRLARELSNFALGRSIERAGARASGVPS